MRCDNCFSDDTYIKLLEEELEYNGKKIIVKGNRRFCSKCNSLVYDKELDNAFLKKAYQTYNKKYGISGDKIVKLRNDFGLSQEDFSKIIGCAKKTLVNYENDNSIPNDNYEIILNSLIDKPQIIHDLISSNINKYSDKELSKINKKLDLFFNEQDLDVHSSEPSLFNGFTSFDFKKFLNVILYFAKSGVNKTKLLKEMFYADFIFYKEHGCSITGSEYAHINYGPVPDNYSFYIKNFIEKGYINIEVEYKGDFEAHIINDEIEFDPFVFDSDELDTLKRVEKYFKDFNSSQIAKYSHKEKAYTDTLNGEMISYDYSFDINNI